MRVVFISCLFLCSLHWLSSALWRGAVDFENQLKVSFNEICLKGKWKLCIYIVLTSSKCFSLHLQITDANSFTSLLQNNAFRAMGAPPEKLMVGLAGASELLDRLLCLIRSQSVWLHHPFLRLSTSVPTERRLRDFHSALSHPSDCSRKQCGARFPRGDAVVCVCVFVWAFSACHRQWPLVWSVLQSPSTAVENPLRLCSDIHNYLDESCSSQISRKKPRHATEQL